MGENLLLIGFLASTQTPTFPSFYLFVAVARRMSQFIISVPSRMWCLEEENPQSCKSQCLCRWLDEFMPLIKEMFLGTHWLNYSADVASCRLECAYCIFLFNYSSKGSSEGSVFGGIRGLRRLGLRTPAAGPCCVAVSPHCPWALPYLWSNRSMQPSPTRSHARELCAFSKIKTASPYISTIAFPVANIIVIAEKRFLL